MKIQPLYDLQREINRLFIAGGKFASGDPRLGKLVPVFEKLGERAPVFKKMASSIQEMIAADSRTAAGHLVSLGGLLYSVLYTQGETLEEGAEKREQRPICGLATIRTESSHARLGFLQDLRGGSSGRYELLKDAFEQGLLADFRAFPQLNALLGDKYTELADLAADTVIPGVGPGMLPFLLCSFAYEDTAEQIRRLRVLAHFAPPELDAMVDRIFAENLPGLQAAALYNILGKRPEQEEFILKLAGDKNKKVREAAWYALGRLATPRALEALKEACFKAKTDSTLEAVCAALALAPALPFLEEILDRLRKEREEMSGLSQEVKDDAVTEAMQRFLTRLFILKGKDQDVVLDFLHQTLDDTNFNAFREARRGVLGKCRLRHRAEYRESDTLALGVEMTVAALLESFDPKKALPFCDRHVPLKPKLFGLLGPGFKQDKAPLLELYFRLSLRFSPPETVYENFAPQVQKKHLKLNILYETLVKPDADYLSRPGYAAGRLDARWLELIYPVCSQKNMGWYAKRYPIMVLHCCEPKNSRLFNALLRQLLQQEEENSHALSWYLHMLLFRDDPKKFETAYSVLEARQGLLEQLLPLLEDLWRLFPKEYAPRFSALRDKTGRDELIEVIRILQPISSSVR